MHDGINVSYHIWIVEVVNRTVPSREIVCAASWHAQVILLVLLSTGLESGQGPILRSLNKRIGLAGLPGRCIEMWAGE